jgi:hypothetical protein
MNLWLQLVPLVGSKDHVIFIHKMVLHYMDHFRFSIGSAFMQRHDTGPLYDPLPGPNLAILGTGGASIIVREAASIVVRAPFMALLTTESLTPIEVFQLDLENMGGIHGHRHKIKGITH